MTTGIVAGDFEDGAGYGDAKRHRQLLAHRDDCRGLARFLVRNVRVAKGIGASEKHRAQDAARQQHGHHHRGRRFGGKQALRCNQHAAENRGKGEHARKAEACKNALCHELAHDGADGRNEGDGARLERIEPKAKLQHQRQQKRHGSNADAEQRAAGDRGAEQLMSEQLWIEQRVGRPPRMEEIEDARGHANGDGQVAIDDRQGREADNRKAEDGA